MARPPITLTRIARLMQLDEFVSLCFAKLRLLPFDYIAEKAKISVSTVRNFYFGRFSLKCHFNTIQSLGYAAGYCVTACAGGLLVDLLD